MQEWLDAVPITVLFFGSALVALAVFECGYRVGRWVQDRTPEEKEGPTAMLVGSLLALQAFLLAIAMGMASDRFDARRRLVLDEANALGTTYLRAGYLPEPASQEIRELLREYVPLRIINRELSVAEFRERLARSTELQTRLWAKAEELARSDPQSEVLGLFIASLNDAIDLHASRVTVGVYRRVPVTVILLLLVGSAVTLGMVGYNAGLTRRRSPLAATVMILVLAAVITLLIDLDRPREGLLTINQQPLIDLAQQIQAVRSNDSGM